MLGLVLLILGGSAEARAADPPYSYRFVWLIPTDQTADATTATAISRVIDRSVAWYRDRLQATIRVTPLQVVPGRMPSAWYRTHGTDGKWNTNHNAAREVFARFKTSWGDADHPYRYVIWINVDGDGGANGPPNFVGLGRMDVVGAVSDTWDTRWVGGLAHELGHTLGLGHTGDTDDDVMRQGLYRFPTATLSAANIAVIRAKNAKWLVPVAPRPPR